MAAGRMVEWFGFDDCDRVGVRVDEMSLFGSELLYMFAEQGRRKFALVFGCIGDEFAVPLLISIASTTVNSASMI